jgi:type IX secretion system PorP/SprF family membrane protein
MKLRAIFFVMGWMAVLSLHAQQRPHYSQYILNNYILNPAITGIENYTDVKFSHRHQWVGIEGAPVTTYFTIHAPIGKKDYRQTNTSFNMKGENPRGKQYWEQYTSAAPHHGIGMQIIDYKTGPLSRFSAYATYAYHLGISAQTSLSGGIMIGMSQWTLNRNQIKWGSLDPSDPAIAQNSELRKWKPDIGIGVWLYSSDYFIGLSAQQLLPTTYSFDANGNYKGVSTKAHIFLSGGYRFFLDDDISMLPSLMVRYIDVAGLLIENNVKFQYQDKLWLGANVRYGEGFAAMAGLNISQTLNISYAYDILTSRLRTVSKGTHEIMVGFILGNRYGDWCPRNVW